MCRVCDGAHGGSAALVVDVSYGLGSNVQHKSVDQLDVVAVSRLVGDLKVQCICTELFIKIEGWGVKLMCRLKKIILLASLDSFCEN